MGAKTPQQLVEEFNRENLIGTKVQFWTSDKKIGQVFKSYTLSSARIKDGKDPVVWVASHAEAINLSRIEVIKKEVFNV